MFWDECPRLSFEVAEDNARRGHPLFLDDPVECTPKTTMKKLASEL